MAVAAGGLFLAGSSLAFLLVILHQPGIDEAGVVFDGVAALALAGICFMAGGRIPSWCFHVLIAAGTILATSTIYFGYEREIVFLPPVLYTAYFMGRRALAAQAMFACACYFAILQVHGFGTGTTARWSTTAVTIVALAILVRVLRERMDRLIDRLADAARTDALTGVLNRRGFQELLELELERARRSGQPVALLFGDLDHFKLVNDRFGHPAGDRALERVTQVLESSKRRIDTAARIGGEEFAIIAPGTDARPALLLAERLRAAIAREFEPDPVPLTISFGVVAFPEHGVAPHDLIDAGDAALYAAKVLGRDRTVLHSAEIDSLLATKTRHDPRGDTQLATLLGLAEALDMRDSGTAGHCQTVCNYTAMMARRLGLEPDQIERVRLAGILHDVGKIGVADSVLKKPGKLTDSEWEEMRRHPEIGARILGADDFEDIRGWVLAHHERPDGKGYPRRLANAQIPLEAKILAVADAYEAMTANRVYRKALGPEIAREELLKGAGSQFDAMVVDVFLAGLEDEAKAKAELAESR